MQYVEVCRWREFQQYKDDRPVNWIKLYTKLLDDYEFLALPETGRYQLIAIWLLAGKLDNKIPHDLKYIGSRISAKSVNLKPLIDAGFLRLVGEAPAKAKPAKELKKEPDYWVVNGLQDAWMKFKKMRRDIRAPVNEVAEERLIKKLEAIKKEHGHQPEPVLLQSVENCWKGVFPLKGGKPGGGLPRTMPELMAYVTKHGLPQPRPGESEDQYRGRLEAML